MWFFYFFSRGYLVFKLSYTSKTTSSKEQLLIDLRNILSEARNFNVLHDVTGVLYFADGTFFQYLEGEKDDLFILKEKLEKDLRHTELQFFEMQEIEVRKFSDWAMKYVSKQSMIQQYLLSCNVLGFHPEQLSQQQVNELVDLLVFIEDHAA